MGTLVDLTGERFFRLLVLGRAPVRKGRTYWFCVCDCGTKRTVDASALRGRRTFSCGCWNSEHAKILFTKHGGSANHMPEYSIWLGIRNRTQTKSSTNYPAYGGRGIKLCSRWQDFSNFLADIGPRPSARHSVGRIDNNGDYSPGNCRWETPEQQHNNKRTNRLIRFGSKRQSATRWAREIGLNPSTVLTRLREGWSERKALRPLQPRTRNSLGQFKGVGQ